MTRHELNDVFATTSFLDGTNAAYLEQLHARYQQDPNAVGADWQAFFASLKDDRDDVLTEARGPSWGRSNGARGLMQQAVPPAFTEEQALDAAKDTLAARMLIRNYRTRGHLIAKLDPLDLS
ncbi:MAG: 2-oxoglutarate dehydrogenase E1 component, partial [Methyloceanibacter sp.]